MAQDSITLSLEEIDAKVAALRKEADRLEEFKRLAIGLGLVKQVPSRRRKDAKSEHENVNDSFDIVQPSGPYAGMGIRLAAIEYLRRKGSAEGATRIAQALSSGGKLTASKSFHRTVDNMLRADLKKKNPEVEKIGRKWALIEWRLPKPSSSAVQTQKTPPASAVQT